MPPSRDGRALGRSSTALVLLFVLLLPAVTTRLNASDEIEYFAWLRSLTFDRDVDFENEYRYFYDHGAGRHAGFHETFLERVNENGRRHNFAPMGTAVLWAPFYALGHLVAGWTGLPQDGFSAPYVSAVTYGSAVYGLLALLLSSGIARQVIGRASSAALVVWLGTPLIFYMYVAPGFSHACSAFAVSLFLWAWLRVRRQWEPRGALLLGLSGALLPMIREQDVFFLAAPALDWLRSWVSAGGSSVSTSHAGLNQTASASRRVGTPLLTAAAGAAAFALAYAPQLAAYTALNGHPSPTDAVGNKMSWMSPHFVGVLASPEHGLLFWTPLAVVAIAGLVWLAAGRATDVTPDAVWLGRLALLMVLLQVYISGAVESWTVAGAFGQRRFVALTPIFVLGVAVVLSRPVPSVLRIVRGGLLGLCIWWNLGLMAQFGLHTMDRQRLTLGANARATFIELPLQLPSLAWRYLADRESFYGLPRR
jgi:hypothetical protein